MKRVEDILAGVLLLILVLALSAFGVQRYGAAQYRLGHSAAVDERAARDGLAVLRRTEENAARVASQGVINLKITETKNEELSRVRERIVVERVRVGAAICGSASATHTGISAGGDETDSPGRLVREDIERDIRALKLTVEEDLASGRACQAAAREHGLAL